MAIARGAGTEIIRTAMFNNVTNATATIISGEQHHIYTVLSLIITAVSGTGNVHGYIQGYDSLGGVINQTQHLFWTGVIAEHTTWVWNDKFSFTGFQSTDESAGLGTDGVKQNALADQGGAAQQYLALDAGSGENLDVFVTFIDQNNS